MSEVKVNKISPRSGTTVTLGDSGDTITLASGVSLTGVNATFTDLDVNVGTNGDGLSMTASGDNYISLLSDSNRSSASATLLQMEGKWNGTVVARMQFVSGTDTTNKDDAQIRFQTASAGTPSTAMTIDSSGNVGIGTSSPSSFNSLADNLVVGTTSGDNGITIATGTANGGRIIFSDNTASPFRGAFEYDHSTDGMITYTNGTERMRIDSSGNVLVSTTDTTPSENNDVSGISLRSNGQVNVSVNGGAGLDINRKTSNGQILRLRKDGTDVGQIGTQSGTDFYIGSSSTANTGLRFQTNEIVPVGNAGGNRSDAIDLGKSNIRWKDFWLSGNIYLGGTGSANALDDYEEGTYTVVVSSTGGQTATLNTSFDTCSYTKIGRVVHARGFIRPTGWDATPSGNIKISLPFANQDLSEESERGAVACHIANTGINLGDWIGLITGANSFFYIYRGNTDSLSVGDSSTYLGSGDDIHFSITYQTGS